MAETFTIQQVAKKFKKDRSTIQRWIERKLFPNAELKKSPVGNYWVIPVADTENFKIPQRGPKKQK